MIVDTRIVSIELEALVLMRHLTLITGRGELDRSAYVILSCLVSAGPSSIARLSDVLGLDASTLNRQTSGMLAEGLVERIPDPDGGVARLFRVTEDGQRRLAKECGAHLRMLSAVTADWQSGEIEQFAASLERFNRAIEKLHGRQWPRDPGDSGARSSSTID